MLPGPVFRWELARAARRPRFFWLRTLYGLLLLYCIWQEFAVLTSVLNNDYGPFEARSLSNLAAGMFLTFASFQVLGVVALTPAAVATVIVEEKQRRTLHYLLASRLSSFEIVGGKLLAKLAYVGAFLAVGLPITGLMTFFGGVEPLLVFLVYGASLSTAFFMACAGMLISTFARRVREAVIVAYAFSFVWFVVPPLFQTLVPLVARSAGWSYPSWVLQANDWILASNPLWLLSSLGSGSSVWMPMVGWLVGLQIAYGSVLLLLSVLALRPVFRRQEGRSAGKRRWLGKGAWKWRLFPKPQCGDDPVLWKERHTSRTSGLARIVGFLIVLVILGALGYATYLAVKPVVTGEGGGYALDELRGLITGVVVGCYIIYALAVSTAVAISVPTEREEDTWSSLLTAPLEAGDVVRGKMLGPLVRFWPIGAVLLLYLLLGIVVDAVHPLAALSIVLELVVFLWFVAAVGMHQSLRAKSSMRAQQATIGTLFVLNAFSAYLLVFLLFLVDLPMELAASGSTPLIMAGSVSLDPRAPGFFNGPWVRAGYGADPNRWTPILVGLVCVAGYAAGAWALTRSIVRKFDAVAERPVRSRYAAMPLFVKTRNARGEPELMDPVAAKRL